MEKIIKFKQITHSETKKEYRLLNIIFTDKSGAKYAWTPKWKDLATILEQSIETERWNGGGHWVEIAKASMWVLSYLVSLLNVTNNGCLPKGIITDPADMIDVKIKKMVI